MAKGLYQLTCDVHRFFATQEHTVKEKNNMEFLLQKEVRDVKEFTPERLEELKHSMEILLRALKRELTPAKHSYVKHYGESHLPDHLGRRPNLEVPVKKATLKYRLYSFAADLFYFSDRWCDERHRCIELTWWLLYAELKANLLFKKQVVHISTDIPPRKC